MAECNTIVECCTGQTECNQAITIGYLKSFVSSDIKNPTGGTVNVTTTENDDYCPTYSELTSGNILPLFVDGGNNKWYNNVDGITIIGTYAPGETVEQKDLVLTYTRYKNLSISAGKTTFDECGDNTSVCATFTFTKTVKAMNGSTCAVSTNSTDGYDTNCNVSFSDNCNWLTIGSCSNNCVNVSADKNGTVSANSRTCAVTVSATYKGSNYSDSLTITQEALTGSYSVYDDRYYTGIEITGHSSTAQNTCESVQVYVSGKGYYYDRYFWKDSCNVVYSGSTNKKYEDRTGSEDVTTSRYTFSNIPCDQRPKTNTQTVSISYHGYSDSMTFKQICSQTPQTCQTTYDYGTCSVTYPDVVDKCGEEVTLSCNLPVTAHTYSWDSSCTCVESSTSAGTIPQSIVVSIPENTQGHGAGATTSYTGSKTTALGGTFNYTIIQDISEPCGGCVITNERTCWDDKTVTIGKCDTQAVVNLTGTKTISYSNCEDEQESVTTSITYTDITQNTGTTQKTYTRYYPSQSSDCKATITINQPGGCACADESTTITYGTVNIDCYSHSTVNLPYTSTTTYSNCDPVIVTGTYSGVTVNIPCNSATSAVSYTKSYNGKNFTVIQAAGNCCCAPGSCDCYRVTNATAATVPSTATSATITWGYEKITWVTGNTCQVSSSVTETGNSSAVVNFEAATCDNFTKSGVLTWSNHKVCESNGCGNSNIQINWSITQERPDGCGCNCGSSYLGVTGISSHFTSDQHTNITLGSYSVNSTCVTESSISASSNQSWLSNLSVGMTNNTIKGTMSQASDDRCASVTINYTSGSKSCSTGFTVCQDGPVQPACDCDTDFTLSQSSLEWEWNETGSTNEKSITATVAPCVSNYDWDFSDYDDFDFLQDGDNDYIFHTFPEEENTSNSPKISYAVISGITDGNQCTKTVALTQKGKPSSTCDCEKFNTSTSSLTWSSTATSSDSRSYTISADTCITNISANTSSLVHFMVTSTVGNTISIAPVTSNTSSNDYIEYITYTYNASGQEQPCTYQIQLKQSKPGAVNCECGDFSCDTSPISFTADGTVK